MPLCKLHLPQAIDADTATRIADALHESLVETCGVNPDDHFYLIQRYGAGDAHAHPTFLGSRDPSATFIAEITLLGGRTESQKETLYTDFRRRVAAIGLDPRNSVVFLVENGPVDWSFGPEGSVKKVLEDRGSN